MTNSPLILAPAGNKDSFLAALAAGADAVYCGLKSFSARMEAKNFSIEELAPLTQLAHDRGTEVYIALNSLMKPGDSEMAGKLLDQLNRWVKPDALIIQDTALLQLAEQTGFSGEIHLSTLAAASFPTALKLIGESFRHRITRVVIPRELGIDEIKAMTQACPPNLDLEVFIHGALCYGVSGRCYWSSYMGGKSGLRGRCVQPCRRLYTPAPKSDYERERDRLKSGNKIGKERGHKRFFSCQDLCLDVLVKALLAVPKVRAWKIEGRKKGPHYVFYTVKAYRILRDHGGDPQMKKTAMELLSQALGRTGTHYYFLPQRPWNPVDINGQTGSGLLVGRVKIVRQSPCLIPREELLSGDVLRIGYEDKSWHCIQKVSKYIPKRGCLNLKFSSRTPPPKDAPVFLTDRLEKTLEEMISGLEAERVKKQTPQVVPSDFHARLPGKYKNTGIFKKNPVCPEVHVKRNTGGERLGDRSGIWLSSESAKSLSKIPVSKIWWWLPPVIWPDEEKKWETLIDLTLKKGARNFVLNSPWQMAFFFIPGQSRKKGLNLWAGPFCNIANTLAVRTMSDMGFSGVIVSPELGGRDYLQLPKHSPLPLGIVISGNWPLCVSRILPENLKTDMPFASPRGEQAWIRQYASDTYIYPNWELDIKAKKNTLHKAGYSMFVHLIEPLPKTVTLKKRPGIWNWDLNLL